MTLPVNGPLNAGDVTVPVKVGEARLAFKASAVCCAVETGLAVSAVLSTLAKPTMDFVMPFTVPENVGEARSALRPSLPLSFLIAVRMLSVSVITPAKEEYPVSALPVTVAAEITVAPCVPVTSPNNEPVKLAALPVTFPVTLPVNGPLNAGDVTVPVKVGEARLAFKFSAVCCAAETGLAVSAVLSTLPKPTMDFVMPFTVPENVGESRSALRPSLPLSLLIAVRMLSETDSCPAPETYPVRTLPVTVAASIAVAPWVPVTSPLRLPLRLSATMA